MKNSFKNSLYNAFGYLFPLALTLFTTPYIIRKLNAELYGVYVLAFSLMGLMSFADLGFGQGIIKFVAQYEAKRDYEKINRMIAVSLFIYLVMGLLGAGLIFLFADFFSKNLFKISKEYVGTASLAFKITSLGFLVSFFNGAFSSIPKALQRYDTSVKIQNAIWFCSTLSMVVLLYFGKGLAEVLLIWIFFQAISIAFFYKASKRILPSLVISFKFDKEVFNETFAFSALNALNTISGNIVFRVDKIVIGIFLGAMSVTYYQIPFLIVQAANGVINAATQFLLPKVSYINALGDKIKLREIYEKSMRYVFTLSLIINSSLILFGNNFLSIWMGKEFAEKTSYILPIMAVVFFFISASIAAFWFYNGLGRPGTNMASSFFGAFFYLAFALILIPKMHLEGAALAFAFILAPGPAYFYFLSRLIGKSFKWHLVIIAKSIFILLSAVLIKIFFVIPPKITYFIPVVILAVAGTTLAAYGLKLINWEDIIEFKNRLRLRVN